MLDRPVVRVDAPRDGPPMTADAPSRQDWVRPALARAGFCAAAAAAVVAVGWMLSHTRVFLAWVLVWPLVGAILVRMARLVWRGTFRPEPTTSAVACETVLIAVGVALGVLATTAVLGSPQSWAARPSVPLVLGVTERRGDTPLTIPPAATNGLAAQDRQSIAARAARVSAGVLLGVAAQPTAAAATTTSTTEGTTTTSAAAAGTGAGPTTTVAPGGSVRVTTTTDAIGSATAVRRATTTTTRAPATVGGTVTTVPVATTPAPTVPAGTTTSPTVATTPAPTTPAPTTPAPTTAAPTTVAPTTTETPPTTAPPG